MALHDDLLAQARELVEVDARRPRNVNLRRAVSSAYYAVFHRLIFDATSRWVSAVPLSPENPGDPRRLRVDHEVARWFQHTRMRTVSEWYRGDGSRVPSKVYNVLYAGKGNPWFPSELGELASTFVQLQVRRHRADYNLSYRPDRLEARHEVNRASEAFRIGDALRTDPAYHLYLMLLLTESLIAVERV